MLLVVLQLQERRYPDLTLKFGGRGRGEDLRSAGFATENCDRISKHRSLHSPSLPPRKSNQLKAKENWNVWANESFPKRLTFGECDGF